VKELIEMIEKGGKRLKYLVDNLVDITRIEYNIFRLEKELTDFSQILRDCTKELMYLILNFLDRGKLWGLMDSPVNQPFFPGNYKPLLINPAS